MHAKWPLRFGSFISPVHSPHEDPTLAIHRDVELIRRMDELGYDEAWIIGTPDDAAAQIHRLWEASGGFGTFLFWAHDRANREATLRSYELFAREVAPRFKGNNESLHDGEAYALRHRPVLAPEAAAARKQATEDYAAQKTREAAQPKTI